MKRKYKRHMAHKPNTTTRWPAVLVVGGLGLLGLVAYIAWQTTSGGAPKVPVEVTGAPRLKLDQDQIDLGDVPLGQTVEVAFRVANVGDQQLRFTEVPVVEVVEGC